MTKAAETRGAMLVHRGGQGGKGELTLRCRGSRGSGTNGEDGGAVELTATMTSSAAASWCSSGQVVEAEMELVVVRFRSRHFRTPTASRTTARRASTSGHGVLVRKFRKRSKVQRGRFGIDLGRRKVDGGAAGGGEGLGHAELLCPGLIQEGKQVEERRGARCSTDEVYASPILQYGG